LPQSLDNYRILGFFEGFKTKRRLKKRFQTICIQGASYARRQKSLWTVPKTP
jgi:hypothetical protein